MKCMCNIILTELGPSLESFGGHIDDLMAGKDLFAVYVRLDTK